MNKISSTLVSLCLMCTAGLALAMEPMDKDGAMKKDAMTKDAMTKDAMTKDAMGKDTMKKDGAMMKAQPKKMEKPHDKMEHGGDMSMEPNK